MRKETDPAAGVTYVGPRAFVIAFCVICGVFVGVLFGLNRIADLGRPDPAEPAPPGVVAQVASRFAAAAPASADAGAATTGQRAATRTSAAPPLFSPTSPSTPVATSSPALTPVARRAAIAAPSVSARFIPSALPARPAAKIRSTRTPKSSPTSFALRTRGTSPSASTPSLPSLPLPKTPRARAAIPTAAPAIKRRAARRPVARPFASPLAAHQRQRARGEGVANLEQESQILVPFKVGVAARSSPLLVPPTAGRGSLVITPSAQGRSGVPAPNPPTLAP